MAALALLMTACSSNDDNDLTTQQPQKAEGITIIAQLAPKTNGASTRKVSEVSDQTTYIKAEWEQNEKIAILYTIGTTNYVSEATIKSVDGTTGVATIEFTVENGTANNTPCKLVYPARLSDNLTTVYNDERNGAKDAVTLLAAQDGTLNATLDVRVGDGTIQTATPGLTVTTQPKPQFAIFKFTTKSSSTINLSVKSLSVTIGTQNYVINPASGTDKLYAALPAVSSETVTFTATGNDDKIYTASRSGITFEKGNFYNSNIIMGQATALSINNPAVGQVIGSDGKNYDDATAASSAGHPAVAMIAYVNGNNGLALALKNEVSSNWSTAISTCAGHTPAFNGGTWKLPSWDDWTKMFKKQATGEYLYNDLNTAINNAGGDAFAMNYWSSSESNSEYAYEVNFDGSYASQKSEKKFYSHDVRACLVF